MTLSYRSLCDLKCGSQRSSSRGGTDFARRQPLAFQGTCLGPFLRRHTQVMGVPRSLELFLRKKGKMSPATALADGEVSSSHAARLPRTPGCALGPPASAEAARFPKLMTNLQFPSLHDGLWSRDLGRLPRAEWKIRAPLLSFTERRPGEEKERRQTREVRSPGFACRRALHLFLLSTLAPSSRLGDPGPYRNWSWPAAV